MVKTGGLRSFTKDNVLLLLTLVGVFVGAGLGVYIRSCDPSTDVVMWIGLPGQLYLRLLKMMIVPLIVTSVISGTSSLDPKVNGKISVVAFTFIFVTNTIGAILGVGTYLIFKPGAGGSEYAKANTDTETIQTLDIFADLLRNTLPDNLFEATFSQVQTAYKNDEDSSKLVNTRQLINGTWANTSEIQMSQIRYLKRTHGPNVIGLIFACTLIGIAAASLKEKGRLFIQLMEAATNTVLTVMRWCLWATPIGVLSLVLVAIVAVSDIGHVFSQLGVFILAVLAAIVVQQLIIMPAILAAITRRNPYRLLLDISRPWLIAFASASTAVTLPEMLQSCEDKQGVDRRVSRFVLPFSVALSANGSAIFIACSCLFISSLTGATSTAGSILVIGLLAAIASLAIPSVPSSSIVTIIMILTSLNIPIEAIALLLAIDFLLDRARTTSSVVSHCMCAVVTHHLCQRDLEQHPDDKYIMDAELGTGDRASKLHDNHRDYDAEQQLDSVETIPLTLNNKEYLTSL